MQSELPTVSPRNGVLLLTGYGIRVCVERGYLQVEDGAGTDRREGHFSRADRDLKRLVVLGHAGTISFDALRWLADVGASFVQIDHDGKVIAAAGAVGLQDARIRRAQAMAVETGRGFAVALELVREKLEGQRRLLDRLPGGARAELVLDRVLDRLDSADSIERLRVFEAEGGLAYWGAWSGVEVRFARNDAQRVPGHWKIFDRRASRVTGNARKATSPANAILNYLYAILEAEARIASLAVGCDPSLGVMHVDQRSRDSLACDLMEPVRPLLDRWVLDLLEQRTFRKADFFETREGACRIMPPVTRILAETAPRWSVAVAPLAEQLVRDLLAEDKSRKYRARKGPSARVPTPLTQVNRSAARKKVRKRSRSSRSEDSSVPRSCVVCGTDLPKSRRQFCVDCQPIQTRDAVSKAHEVLRARRLAGDDPAHGGEAARRRGSRNAAVLTANAEWDRAQRDYPDPAAFVRMIAPGLTSVPLATIMRATGLSRPYCAMIRRGARVPHPRHWEALRHLS